MDRMRGQVCFAAGLRFKLLALALALAAALVPVPGWGVAFTGDFRLEGCTWSAWGRQNLFFNLRPGFRLVLEGEEDGGQVHLEITVTDRLEPISFRSTRGTPVTVLARVVEERETHDGRLAEVSRNWFARCIETSDVFYFGEEVDLYENGAITGHEGSWRAGNGGALPGIVMPGTFLLGARYFQESAPGVAQDRAEHVAMGVALTLPFGTLGGCVTIEETSPLTPGAAAERKTYCPRLGLVREGSLELVSAGVVP